jgi:hypothetical protein
MKNISMLEFFKKDFFTDLIQNNIEIINSTTSIDDAADTDYDTLNIPELTVHIMNQGINKDY